MVKNEIDRSCVRAFRSLRVGEYFLFVNDLKMKETADAGLRIHKVVRSGRAETVRLHIGGNQSGYVTEPPPDTEVVLVAS